MSATELNPLGLKTYLGNDSVKAHGVAQPLTQYQLDEYNRCADDPVYFARNYVNIISLDEGLIKFDLWPYQETMYDIVQNNRFSIVLAPRQSGKSQAFVIYLLWFALFEPEKTVFVLANKGDTAQEMLARIILALENLPFWLQPGCKTLNKRTIEFSNNSRIFARPTSTSSIRGNTAHLIFLDEFALVEKDEEFYTSTYPVITSGKKSKVIITSTPKGVGNMFHKFWEGAKTGTNQYVPFEVHWSDVPGRDEEWKRITIANTSEHQFNQEFGCQFLGSGDTLIEARALLSLTSTDPAFTSKNVRIYEKPQEDHQYIMTVDSAKGKGHDNSAFSIIDVTETPFRVVAAYHNNKISPLLFPTILVEMAKRYNNAYMVIESNDQGYLVARTVNYDFGYDNIYYQPKKQSASELGLTMSAKVKKIGCSVFKDFIETGKLITKDRATIKEIISFEKKGDSWSCPRGGTDDLVMTLVIFSYFTTQAQFSNFSEVNVKDIIFDKDAVQELEAEELPSFGIVDYNNKTNEEETWDDAKQFVKDLDDRRKIVKDTDFGWAIIEENDGWVL